MAISGVTDSQITANNAAVAINKICMEIGFLT